MPLKNKQQHQPTMRTKTHDIKVMLICLLAAAVLSLTLLPGCGSTTHVQNQTSVGQQLQDLDKSYKDGLITQKEYEKLKKKIIKEND
jgi:hypothetical protein